MSSTASAPAGEPATTCPRRHHAVELELNACGVECCPHDAHKGLVAVASYLHRPGDEDTPQSRVGQLYLYDLRPSDESGDRGDITETGGDDAAEAPPAAPVGTGLANEWTGGDGSAGTEATVLDEDALDRFM